MLPQVLAGLGVFSAVGLGCFYWLERLQPVFFALALLALAYELWLVGSRPRSLRTPGMLTMVAFSFGLNAVVVGATIFLWLRYR